MVYHRKRRYHRRAKRRGNRVATVAKVRKMIRGSIESKWYANNIGDLTMGAQKVYLFQPFQTLTQGTSANQRLGTKISTVRLQVSVNWSAYGNNVTNDTRLSTGAPLRIMLIRTTRNVGTIGTGGWSSPISVINQADTLQLFCNGVQTVNSLMQRDTDTTVVKQFWVHSTQPTTALIAGSGNIKFASWYLPRYEFDQDTGYAAKYNYYILATASAPGMPSNSTIGTLQFHTLTTFKDA